MSKKSKSKIKVIAKTAFELAYLAFPITLMSGIASKISGNRVGYRGGLTYRGGILAEPDTLDIIASDLRKLIDKKYRKKKKIEEIESYCNNEIQNAKNNIFYALSEMDKTKKIIKDSEELKKLNELTANFIEQQNQIVKIIEEKLDELKSEINHS